MALRVVKADDISFEIHYDIVNQSAKKDIVFLHGWGSNREIMKKAFAHCFSDFRHIYIDMPGFGKSLNSEVLTTEKYAQIIGTFLDNINSNRFAIAGHSFGGKVATLLEPKNLILLSSSGIPEAKKLSVKIKIAIFKVLKPLGFSQLYRFFATKDAKGMPKNMYETLKNVVNENFAPVFANYNGKALIFWGKDDTATPLRAGEKISSLITNNIFTPLDGNHYFFLEHCEAIEKVCLEKFSS
jgi:pimeloyl-ACP methyl ester carboxylesterase